MDVEIFYTATGRGLAKDAQLLAVSLDSLGHSTVISPLPAPSFFLSSVSKKWFRFTQKYLPSSMNSFLRQAQRIVRRWTSFRKINADLVIHLENIHPACIRTNKVNWLIPNQEWFRRERLHYLADVDRVLCKTQAALQQFSVFHTNVTYTGFSSIETSNATTPSTFNENSFLHLAGKSPFKGTDAVVQAWLKHPEWPLLTVVKDRLVNLEMDAKNICFKSAVMDSEMAELWESASYAIIPSEVEGFGQALIEAMVAGKLVLTTDAPPMNELVTAARGIGIRYHRTEPFRLGTRYFVSVEAIEESVQGILAMSRSDKEALALESIRWIRTNHINFIRNLEKALADAI